MLSPTVLASQSGSYTWARRLLTGPLLHSSELLRQCVDASVTQEVPFSQLLSEAQLSPQYLSHSIPLSRGQNLPIDDLLPTDFAAHLQARSTPTASSSPGAIYFLALLPKARRSLTLFYLSHVFLSLLLSCLNTRGISVLGFRTTSFRSEYTIRTALHIFRLEVSGTT